MLRMANGHYAKQSSIKHSYSPHAQLFASNFAYPQACLLENSISPPTRQHQFLNEISEIKLPCFREWLSDKDTR
ncbi:hypothetical protein CEXT_557581 [Caerostris extrusa]|uniref:Uncharacterized protein n=1 Tax=Caerostris extrusa TaxID=172846 RepID=A0AAV4T950_CAEEX|nr:hypothetical protein CEXT_557581 [Caerostris extrusa]